MSFWLVPVVAPNFRRNLCWWAEPQSDPMSALSLPLGPQTGVYLIFPSPRGRTHCGVLWPLSELLAHCQACGAALMGSGHVCIRRGRSARCTGAGGPGLACFAVGDPLQQGPCSTGREAGRSEVWIHRNTALGICVGQAIWCQELVPFGISAGGWEREMALASTFIPLLSSALLWLNNSSSQSPLTLLALESRAVDF